MLACLLQGLDDRLEFPLFAVSHILRPHETSDMRALRGALGRIAPGKKDVLLSTAAEGLMPEAAIMTERETLLRLLERRFAGLPEDARLRVKSADTDHLDS